ncbi:unnamed protein product [Candidula unifasciata]|uniref:Band 7 domain-containing protein n=1 Tax=Candidula unifasciata TaxID=100452 RepID=A0A8S3YXF1_9EUPU|nr:unnamed protein product [Candidula unifasciata]
MTIGWKTLDVGEKALIYNKDGSARIIEGPLRLFLFRELFKKMICYSANQKEYLVIKYRNGNTEHMKGPCTVHMNEIIHISVVVKNLISLDANEALIVYSQNIETQRVMRRIQFGPTLFMLGENEWLHNFSWHGTDPDNKTRMIPNQNKFTVLKIIADQFYYNVDEVRTADDAILRVKLMMFFELTDIEKMLNSTNDPMADFINCLCADVIAFAAKRTYEDFTETASDLNHLENFSQLVERSQAIGYSVSKVIFRGYFAHDKLQKMHDMMIIQRTELRLKYEREVQEQELIHKKLQADTERLEQEQQLELERLLHEQRLEKDELQHTLNLEKGKHEKMIDKQKMENKAKLNENLAKDRLDFQYLSSLHGLSVNVTDLLVTRAGKPARVTHIKASKDAAHIHIHHNDLSAYQTGSP